MTDTPPELESYARAVFEQQPFSRLIGARLVGVTIKQVEIALDIRPEHLQQHGYVHGGVLSYLADNAITFAGGLALKGDAVTSEYKINYIRPARGISLLARGIARGIGRQQAVCTCELFHAQGH